MVNPSKLLSAYKRMVAAEEEKHRLMPERLVTLIAGKSWIKAVSKHIGARRAFLDAAIEFFRSENARAKESSQDISKAADQKPLSGRAPTAVQATQARIDGFQQDPVRGR